MKREREGILPLSLPYSSTMRFSIIIHTYILSTSRHIQDHSQKTIKKYQEQKRGVITLNVLKVEESLEEAMDDLSFEVVLQSPFPHQG